MKKFIDPAISVNSLLRTNVIATSAAPVDPEIIVGGNTSDIPGGAPTGDAPVRQISEVNPDHLSN